MRYGKRKIMKIRNPQKVEIPFYKKRKTRTLHNILIGGGG